MTCVSVSTEQPLKLSCFSFISIQSLSGPNLPYENYCTQENNFVENKLSWWLLSNRASKRHKKYFREKPWNLFYDLYIEANSKF